MTFAAASLLWLIAFPAMILLIVYGAMSVWSRYRDARLEAYTEDLGGSDLIGDEWKDGAPTPHDIALQDRATLEELNRAPDRKLEEIQYYIAENTFKLFVDAECEDIELDDTNRHGEPCLSKYEEDEAHNRAIDNMKVWLENKNVVMGYQACDFLAMNPKRYGAVKPIQAAPSTASITAFVMRLEAAERKLYELPRLLLDQNLQKSIEFAQVNIYGSENAVIQRIERKFMDKIDERVRAILRTALGKELKELTEIATKAAKQQMEDDAFHARVEAEEASKELGPDQTKASVQTCANCEDLSDESMFEGPENCGCPTRPGVIAMTRKYFEDRDKRQKEDEAFDALSEKVSLQIQHNMPAVVMTYDEVLKKVEKGSKAAKKPRKKTLSKKKR